jgi:precorrin-6B methylase 2
MSAFIIFLLIGFILVIITTGLYASITTAPFVPSNKKIIEEALKLAELKENEVLYDLGCGDGKVLIIGAKKFKAQTIGYELSFLRYLITKANILINGCKNKARVYFQDLYQANLSQVDVIYIWLTPKAFPKLKEKFNKELKIGTRVVAFSSPLNFWQPDKVLNIQPSPNQFLGLILPTDGGCIYLYTKK